ncbi:FecR family protein [Cyclobacterium lianum]|uniref:FecR family protein n=1 Tax=Cyclobacterium lianum TaxID=388280 RepID=A0A1M7LD90_9BACT|nr:FecR domain-containing protein [Cyclobacterium lianum]SHM76127.1 FecR family protein [Cyclobacterium lianum]
MDKSIIRRFIHGQASPSETKRVKDWLSKPGSDRELEEILEEVWRQQEEIPANSERRDRLLSRINIGIAKRAPIEKKPLFHPALIRSAAVWLFIIGLAFLGFKVIQDHAQAPELSPEPVQWVERTVRPGQKLALELSDDSKVWVNANSKIRFPNRFSRDSREVFLEGEAFFEVSHDANRPFRVHSGELTTEVLGTKFNVKSHQNKTDVALLDGKVKVRTSRTEDGFLLLDPGQMAAFRQDNPEKLQRTTFENRDPFLWKDGLIHYKNEKFKEVISSLETWYGVSVRTTGNLDLNRTVSGTFSNDNLDNMLTGLGFTLNFTHHIENDIVTIYPQ